MWSHVRSLFLPGSCCTRNTRAVLAGAGVDSTSIFLGGTCGYIDWPLLDKRRGVDGGWEEGNAGMACPKFFKFAVQVSTIESPLDPATSKKGNLYSSPELSRYSVRLTAIATASPPTRCPASRSAMKAEYCTEGQP